MKTDNYHSPFKRTLTFFNREEYDSGYEARFGGTCYFLDIAVNHNDKVWLFDDAAVPQYKPDFNWVASTGEIVAVEVKGWPDERWFGQRDKMRELVDDPGENVIALVYATRIKEGGKHVAVLTIYQNGQELPAAFYQCPSCGKGYIAAKEHSECPRCGETDVKYICVDFNQWFNEESARRREKAIENFKEKSKKLKADRAAAQEMTSKLRRRIERLAREEQLDIENTMGVLSPYATGEAGEYRPDYSYDEPKRGYSYYGTVCSPFVPVFVSANPSELEEKRYEEMREYVADRMCPVVKCVVVDAAGIHVCDDKQKRPEYEPGSMYTCDKCGATYFARDNHHDCPCCDSKKTHKVSK